MIKTNLGKISITNKGEYSAATTYETLDVVSFNGSSYMAKQQTVGNSPENTNYWQLLAAKGDTPVKGVDYFTQADIASLPQPDLSGYALASDVYSKDDVDDMVAAIESSALKRIIVQELPAVNISSNAIYMIRNLSSSGQNQYDEFMWNENDGSGRWEYIGNTQVDLTGYATESWVNNQGFLKTHQDISGKANSADLATVATSGSYNDLSNKPTIPTKTSDLTNDSGFVTSVNVDLTNVMIKGTDYVTAGLMEGISLGARATAEGFNVIAGGHYSHAEGKSTQATAQASHAEGIESNANGISSHAEGGSCGTKGSYSHAEGYSTYAKGDQSHAEGFNTYASHRSQHVFGEYNVYDDSTKQDYQRGNYVEIVGNGTNSARSNARTLDWNGNEVLAGKLTVGTDPTENMDVATKQYVDSAVSGSGGGATYTAGNGINIDSNNVIDLLDNRTSLVPILYSILTRNTGMVRQDGSIQNLWDNRFSRVNLTYHIDNLKTWRMTYFSDGLTVQTWRSLVEALEGPIEDLNNPVMYKYPSTQQADQYTYIMAQTSATLADNSRFNMGNQPVLVEYNPNANTNVKWIFISYPERLFQNIYFNSQQGLTSHSIAAAIDEVASRIPAVPSTDGSYMLKCTVASGVPTYTWEAVTVGGSY